MKKIIERIFDEETVLFILEISYIMSPLWGFITTLALIKETFF